MPRVREISQREQVAEDQRQHFDWIMSTRGLSTPLTYRF